LSGGAEAPPIDSASHNPIRCRLIERAKPPFKIITRRFFKKIIFKKIIYISLFISFMFVPLSGTDAILFSPLLGEALSKSNSNIRWCNNN